MFSEESGELMDWREICDLAMKCNKEEQQMEFVKCKQYGVRIKPVGESIAGPLVYASDAEKALRSIDIINQALEARLAVMRRALDISNGPRLMSQWGDRGAPPSFTTWTIYEPAERVLQKENAKLRKHLRVLADKLDRSSAAKSKGAVRCAFEAEQLRKLVQS